MSREQDTVCAENKTCAARAHRLSDIVRPALEPGQQAFLDLAYTDDGAVIDGADHVWEYGITLIKAEGVGKTGVHPPY